MANRKKRRRSRNSNRQIWMALGGIVGIIVLTFVVLMVARNALGNNDPEGVKTFKDQGNQHIPQSLDTYVYNSRPPTSGPHAQNIAQWGIHTEPIPEYLQVHNLEDGGVIIHYNCPEGCPEIVGELTDIVRDNGTEQLVLEPYPDMDSRIAVTAWTKMLTMEEVDRDRIEEFIEKYRGLDHHVAPIG